MEALTQISRGATAIAIVPNRAVLLGLIKPHRLINPARLTGADKTTVERLYRPAEKPEEMETTTEDGEHERNIRKKKKKKLKLRED
ncbi:hypothetical protein DY000_02051420 [Brassica cretica]|uniref:Nop domain-containing protein n=1 Tax=Brassica cretica TaxID=69181 RepID=A0ABQ7F092_BRACR|nr:hypothetical protein DY000_02051420 [Brassica cretica]